MRGKAQAYLFQVVRASCPMTRGARLLNSHENQTREHADYGQHDK
jgi:hypothetical protein